MYFTFSGRAKEFDLNYMSTTQNLPYDYKSIMHFSAYKYSRNGKPTLQPLDKSIPESDLGISDTPTELDYLHINLLYGEGKSIMERRTMNCVHMNC